MITIMSWDGTELLVLIEVILDGRVCNELLIFIAPPYPLPFSTSSAVSVSVNVSWSSSASLLPRIIIKLPMLFILLLVQSRNRAATPDPTLHTPWLLRWAEIDPDNI